ncbi:MULTISPECIES: gliding motility protein GldM [Flavobacterium]|uniref:Gliding motility protein GldM n=1 Tax=Flavobacterium jumunjinense TaxID=998845 RepID=A0ABV5GNI0_9FLAO|nr:MULTISPECIES: gliding motility protein GldM [Flavobacterium]
MAGGKLTPRQKMINLMYLVFIAMLALNMSKEVLTAFGLMNEKFTSSNSAAGESNDKLLQVLEQKAGEDASKFAEPNKKAQQIAKISTDFYAYLEAVKKDITKDFPLEDGKLPFEAMDKSTIDEAWFKGDGYSPKGTEIVNKFNEYVAGIKKSLGNDTAYQLIIKDVEKKFGTEDVKDKEGVKKKYLDYHFKGFPAIATVSKLTALQNDIKATETGAYNVFLGNTYKAAASMKNYQGIVILDKSAFFAGEAVKGKIVLGKYDNKTVPSSVVINGNELDLATAMENGAANFSIPSGNIGEHKIEGKFTFMEDGKPVPVDITGNYVVVPKPNSATISADKMNVVYRGVINPMTISFAGISDDKVSASAAGLSKGSGVGKYNMNPGQGREVSINVRGTLPDGTAVSDSKTFRIKGIPGPNGTIRGEYAATGPKTNLEVCSVGAKLEDFDFEVGLNVTGFTIKVPGQPTVLVSGNRMDSRAKAAIAKAQRGDMVVISNIQTKLVGAGNYMLPKTSPCTYEIK